MILTKEQSKVACFMILFLKLVQTEVNKNKTNPIEEYLNPEFYWPLDYSTWIREIITGKTAVVTENSDIGIKGEKPGFLQFPVQLASAQLGTFSSNCLVNIGDCDSGLTIGLWVKMENMSTSGSNDFKLFWTKRDSSGEDDTDEPYMQIRYSVGTGGNLTLKVIMRHDKIESSIAPIKADKWYHVILQYSKTTNMVVYLNAKKLDTVVTPGKTQSKHKNIVLMLGKDAQKDGGKIIRHSNIASVDNLAIWEKLLTLKDIRKIYFVEFGAISIPPRCRNQYSQFEVKWYKADDYYKHITLYKLYWWTGNISQKDANKIVFPPSLATRSRQKEVKSRLFFFERNRDYKIVIEADTESGIPLKSEIICDSKNVAGGIFLRSFSRTPFTITVTWKQVGAIDSVYYLSYTPIQGGITKTEIIRNKQLKKTLHHLRPNTQYKIKIRKNKIQTGETVFYQGIHKTIPIASTLNTSIVSSQIVYLGWDWLRLKFSLHKQLAQYPMQYNISKRNMDNPLERTKYFIYSNITDTLSLTFGGRMDENTSYEYNVEVSDEGIYKPGPKMSHPLVVKTKVRFMPPVSISFPNVSATIAVVSVSLPNEASDSNFKITHLKIKYQSSLSRKEEIVSIHQANHVVLDKLSQFTVYNVSISTGDGVKFGKDEKTEIVRTADDNECDRNDSCVANSLCNNTPGSYYCECITGFNKVNETCIDINECDVVTACNGEINKYCVNLPGSYRCDCLPGYVLKDDKCQDINECMSDKTCDENSICTNIEGSYKCNCKDGFKMEGNRCTDINECLVNNTCGENSVCINEAGAYRCECKTGYTLRGNKCSDINECLANMTCGINFECINTIGSYVCQCQHGFILEDRICVDIDECSGGNKCQANTACVNTIGSYDCICKPGFNMTEGLCEDVDECRLISNTCDENAVCKNTLGSYLCQCKPGFTMKGNECGIVTPLETNDTCKATLIRNIYWPATKVERTAIASCPEGKLGKASRTCVKGHKGEPLWGEFDLSNCTSVIWATINMKETNMTGRMEVATTINSFMSTDEEIYGGDVRNVVGLLDTLINTGEGSKITAQFTETVVNITSSLLDDKSVNAWKDLPQEKRSKDAALLLETSDSVVKASANIMSQNASTKTFVTDNIVMRLQRFERSEELTTLKLTPDNTVELPVDAVGTGESVTVATVTYYGLSDLIGVPKETTLRNKKENLTINSEVISISVIPLQKKTFTKPVVIMQKLYNDINKTQPNCVYWQKKDEKAGYWSDKGCLVHSYNRTHVTCHCFHLTNFAVLMSPTDAADKLTGTHRLVLSLITTVGMSVSLVALVASFFTFIFIRAIHSFRNTIHQHLVVALFLAEIIFLFGIERTESTAGCQVIAASLHYFFLASFFIMGLEGVVLYLMLVRVYRSMGTSGYGSTKYVILCWVLPLVFLMINLFADDHAYGMNRSYCWLSLQHGFIWSFIGPVLFVVVMNLVILVMTLKIMSQKAKKRTTVTDEIWFWVKGCSLLLCILGVTWIIGVFYVDMNTIFAAYLFNIINSLQGLSIFIFHCICDPRVRKAYYNFFCCVRHKQQTLLRSNSRTRTTSTGSKSSLKGKKRKYNKKGDKEHLPLYMNGTSPDITSNGHSSTPNDSFGVLVGTNNF
ncbi:adhesion G protein-coupled receptor E1-like isoform X3 [Hydractinia symbiolongicarpus]|uniref:adhesion G protein-coupled receptor E1-like isoform X3 n=1 Tax=Hydractinia symbiolongicarpus TaxID=13093 RepID=UPI00254F9032|nr:adhesion G protein-coupled receptor E1-like isoform X3 [Hydractinia symbiolongicarpus]